MGSVALPFTLPQPREGGRVKIFTLCFVFAPTPEASSDGELCRQVLLGFKKRGFATGKWNGFGGKVEPGETIHEAAVRELHEECGLHAPSLAKRAVLWFTLDTMPDVMEVHVFATDEFTGEVTESEEMRPQWYHTDQVPLQLMWADDEHWLPLLFAGKSFVGRFDFSDESTIIDWTLKEVPLELVPDTSPY
eukprot:TRINITY_DN41094_c0_g1_i1.p1 TRINITY_DN41094_c0_g1~~TRINITY_DN41094_c0_g1_i1.p1  ORF type:complete len:199 (-),score=46.84 TRINITY_DN41094_c0_g1_i1:86-658(-)